MPHPDYKNLNADFNNTRRFVKEYRYFTAQEIGASMAVAVRKKSKYARDLHDIFE